VRHRCSRGFCIVEELQGNDKVVYELGAAGKGRELYRRPRSARDLALSPDGKTAAALLGSEMEVNLIQLTLSSFT
jgi:hypothetical protein